MHPAMHLQAQVQCPAPAVDREMDVMVASAAAADKNELSPAARETPQAAAATAGRVKCEGVVFTVTAKGNEVAQVAGRGGGGVARVLGSESFFDSATCTRHHFVDVQGKAEAMLFLVSVREDQRRIVSVQRFA